MTWVSAVRLVVAFLTLFWVGVRDAGAEQFARPTSVAEVQAYLEGAWLEGVPADKGDCRTHWYEGEPEIEFEFRKSGGRLMIFEPYDLFQQIQIAKVEISGDIVSIFALARNGTFIFFKHLRIVSANQFESIYEDKPTTKVYRCSAPDLSVNEHASIEDLRLLTPPISGGLAFPQAVDGLRDDDVCEGKAREKAPDAERGSIQFELIGPVHFWVNAQSVYSLGEKLNLDRVQSVRSIAPGKLKLRMRMHGGIKGGWDPPGGSGEVYDLTVIVTGKRIEIPEIGKTFVRCDPPGRGMHRWGQ
jgi:hypothetical protein